MKENNRGASEIIKKFQTKNALKESKGSFSFLAQDNMEAILLVKDGICLEANQTAADMFGFTNFSELIDKKVRELLTAESYNLIKESLINSSDFHCAIGIHKTGTQFPITIQHKIMPEEMGDLFAFSIANITQNNRLQNINKTLFAISNAVNTTLDLNDLYRQIHILLSKIIDVTNFYIAIVNHEQRKIRFPYHVDQKDDDYEPIMDFDLNNSLTGLVVLKRKPILLDNKSLDQRFAKIDSWGPPCLIWMGVPLIIKDEVIGIIAVQSYTDPHLYNQQDLEILTSVSDQVAIAIDRKQAEDSLRESEKRYRQLFNNAPVGMYEIDFIEFRFVEVNQTMCAYLGYSEEEFLGMDPLMPFTEESQALFHERYEKILKGENVSENIEYNFIKKDGEQLCVLIKSDLIFENGKLTGARVVADDITERKKIEEMMIQSEKMMSVGGLAAGMAHEINNPLAGMIQNAQLVQNRLAKSLPVNEKVAEELGTSMAVIQK
ncbi:MAG: PAS domain S-box protein, partial [Desulfobacteraceae bacterium]|nr:PAS domain S-box protein [Desulfobacteraceae bacterium]